MSMGDEWGSRNPIGVSGDFLFYFYCLFHPPMKYLHSPTPKIVYDHSSGKIRFITNMELKLFAERFLVLFQDILSKSKQLVL